MKGKSYPKTDAFAKHFVQFCQDCTTSNQVRARLKKIVEPSIIWKGDRIRCMKSSRTLQCKICMVKRKEILHRLKNVKSKVINDNSDIYSSCKCGLRFHKFVPLTIESTLRTRSTQKKVPSSRKSKRNCRRSSRPTTPPTRTPRSAPSSCTPITPESASPQPTPRRIDTNVPGLPYQSLSYNPTNLELAQFQDYQSILQSTIMEV